MKKKPKKEFGVATRARVKKEMAKPRMAKSVREGEISLGAARIAPVSHERNKRQPDPG
jgi:hypothetical protein